MHPLSFGVLGMRTGFGLPSLRVVPCRTLPRGPGNPSHVLSHTPSILRLSKHTKKLLLRRGSHIVHQNPIQNSAFLPDIKVLLMALLALLALLEIENEVEVEVLGTAGSGSGQEVLHICLSHFQ